MKSIFAALLWCKTAAGCHISAHCRGAGGDQTADRAALAKVLGIGVVMPGPFGVEGISSMGPTTLHGWEDVDIAARLAEMSGLPVTLENDATVAAIGERFHGVARHLNSFIYLYIGTGGRGHHHGWPCTAAMRTTPVK